MKRIIEIDVQGIVFNLNNDNGKISLRTWHRNNENYNGPQGISLHDLSITDIEALKLIFTIIA